MSARNHYINARREFEDYITGKSLYCAYVEIQDTGIKVNAFLPVGYTQKDYSAFLQCIDHTYNNCYGGQKVYGKIWHTVDTMWSTRKVGSHNPNPNESWCLHKAPNIPECLKQEV